MGEIIGKLLDVHYILVAEPRWVAGRFNSHLTRCLLLHADEAFWAGDHSAEGKLKDLNTGNKHPIEFKGREPIFVDNFIRLFVTGNPDWIVPAAFEERRFAIFDAGEGRRGDHAYFAAMINQMEHGGYEALLYYLLNFDLSQVNLRVIPRTTPRCWNRHTLLATQNRAGWWIC